MFLCVFLDKRPTNNILLKLALEAAFDHEILREDEYLKSFLCVEVFSNCVQLIKNVEPPVQVKKEYFGGKWSVFSTNQIDKKVKTRKRYHNHQHHHHNHEIIF